MLRMLTPRTRLGSSRSRRPAIVDWFGGVSSHSHPVDAGGSLIALIANGAAACNCACRRALCVVRGRLNVVDASSLFALLTSTLARCFTHLTTVPPLASTDTQRSPDVYGSL